MLFLEAVDISKKHRGEISLLPFARDKLRHCISNFTSHCPAPEGSLLPGGAGRAAEGAGGALLPPLSCRGQSCPSQPAPLPPRQQHKGAAALRLPGAFLHFKEKSVSLQSCRIQLVTLRNHAGSFSTSGNISGQSARWPTSPMVYQNKQVLSSYGCLFCLNT